MHEIRPQASSSGAPFRERGLGDGLRDARVEVLVRRSCFLKLQDLLRVGGDGRGVTVRMWPSSELPEHVNPKYAVTSTVSHWR